MEIITHKCGDATLTSNIHGNRLEKATPENIRTQIIAGQGQKDGRLYVFKKSTRITPDTPVVNPGLEIDYIAYDEMTDFTYKHYRWLRRFLRRKKLSPLTQLSLDYIQWQRKISKQWLILTHFYGDKRYYFRWRLYWLWQDILNTIFSVNPKGMLRPLSYLQLCMWKTLYDVQRKGYEPFTPVVGPKMYDILLRGDLAFDPPKANTKFFNNITS